MTVAAREHAMDEWVELLNEAGKPGRDLAARSLARIHELKGIKKGIEDELSALEGLVKRALELDPDPLVGELAEDSPARIVASLKERRKPASIDLGSLASEPNGERYLGDAARAGVLTASLTPLRALKGRNAWADALLSREMPGGVSDVLVMEVVNG